MLSLVLGASTHAFELMLSAFILGLSIGSLWITRRVDNLVNPIKTLGIIQVIMGVLALSTLIIYDGTFNIMSYMLAALSKTNQGYILFNLFYINSERRHCISSSWFSMANSIPSASLFIT